MRHEAPGRVARGTAGSDPAAAHATRPADVGCFAEWEVEVELDPQALARAVGWLLGRLVDECRTEDVPPVGVLTIADAGGANLGDFRTVRRSVNLQIDPVAVWDWAAPAPELARRSWWARLRRRVLANPR